MSRKSMKRMKVLLGMSGGTDSSVAAMLLQDAGYEVIGVTFRFYELNDSTEYLDDARRLAESLGMKHITFDARVVFKEQIVDYFIDEYMSGRTPVPCTLCNNYLKWPLLAQLADEQGIPFIATGHYVQKRLMKSHYFITQGLDEDKDQSFFLWGLKQEILSRMLLPLGRLTKKEVREIAQERGFLKVARKKDSLGVCFCPMDYRSFLRNTVDKERIETGFFYDEKGKILGKHEGFPFYTVGQRRGLGIHLNWAVFVKEINPEKNRVVLGDLQSLEQNEMYLKDWNITLPELLLGQKNIIVKIRYRKQANPCTVTLDDHNLLHVQLHEPLTAIAPGQAAAFYLDDVVVGGGIIL